MEYSAPTLYNLHGPPSASLCEIGSQATGAVGTCRSGPQVGQVNCPAGSGAVGTWCLGGVEANAADNGATGDSAWGWCGNGNSIGGDIGEVCRSYGNQADYCNNGTNV